MLFMAFPSNFFSNLFFFDPAQTLPRGGGEVPLQSKVQPAGFFQIVGIADP